MSACRRGSIARWPSRRPATSCSREPRSRMAILSRCCTPAGVSARNNPRPSVQRTMKLTTRSPAAGIAAALLLTTAAFATNPLILDQFTADPTARVFEGRIYVYPSHDIREPAGYSGRPNWFVMEDYHVFSSANLTDWKDHGVILTRNDVPWADKNAYAMWAPDAVFKDGKYYFYFPAMAQGMTGGGGMRIGVA